MKRKFLVDLGLDQNVVNKVLNAVGAEKKSLNSQIEKLSAEVDCYKILLALQKSDDMGVIKKNENEII